MSDCIIVSVMYEYVARPSKKIYSSWVYDGKIMVARYNINILILQSNDIRYARKVK